MAGQKKGLSAQKCTNQNLSPAGSFQVKSTQLLTPMFQFFVIFCNFVALIKLYNIKLQSEIIWELQGVKILTTDVNNARWALHVKLKYFYHI